MRTSTRLFFIVVLAAFVSSACGYRGALHMSDPTPTSKTVIVK